MSNNELIAVDLASIPTTGLSVTSDIFQAVAKSGSFLERVQLYTKGNAIDNGLIAPGRYGVPRGDDVIQDLGNEMDILPVCCRVKALNMQDRDNIITNYDSTSEAFRAIKELGDKPNSNCMYGPTFLVFERSSGQFYEFFCGTSSTRKEAPKIGYYLPKSAADAETLSRTLSRPVSTSPEVCTLKVKYIKKPTYGWHVPVCVPCSSPMTNLPSREVILEEIAKFMAMKSTEAEVVAAEDATARRRAR
jgi:hypothetical protein